MLSHWYPCYRFCRLSFALYPHVSWSAFCFGVRNRNLLCDGVDKLFNSKLMFSFVSVLPFTRLPPSLLHSSKSWSVWPVSVRWAWAFRWCGTRAQLFHPSRMGELSIFMFVYTLMRWKSHLCKEPLTTLCCIILTCIMAMKYWHK